MSKPSLLKKYFIQKDKLTLTNAHYRRQVGDLLDRQLADDLGERGDITTDNLIASNKFARANIIAKERGVVAGAAEAAWWLRQQGIKARVRQTDGAVVKNRDVILELNGGIKDILKVERIVLNLMQRMCGIATQTALMTKMGKHKVLLVATRKLLWGLMDKKAVVAGGGGSHRLTLDGFIMVKDNHLEYLDGKIEDKARTWKRKNIFWEIEVDNLEQAKKYAPLGPGAIMLDNFTVEAAKMAAKYLRLHYPQIIIEISGCVNIGNIARYATVGADVISLGALTHSVKALDVSLDIL